MIKEMTGTHFSQVAGRLLKELSASELNELYQRDADNENDYVWCVLCMAGFPNGSQRFSLATCYHHIQPRQMGGGNPNELSNLAPTCNEHHAEPICSIRELWQRAMVYTQKAKQDDYAGLDWELYPPLRECFGQFGFGTIYYATRQGIPETLQQVFVGKVDRRFNDFCLCLCPVAIPCLRQTRAKILESVRMK